MLKERCWERRSYTHGTADPFSFIKLNYLLEALKLEKLNLFPKKRKEHFNRLHTLTALAYFYVSDHFFGVSNVVQKK